MSNLLNKTQNYMKKLDDNSKYSLIFLFEFFNELYKLNFKQNDDNKLKTTIKFFFKNLDINKINEKINKIEKRKYEFCSDFIKNKEKNDFFQFLDDQQTQNDSISNKEKCRLFILYYMFYYEERSFIDIILSNKEEFKTILKIYLKKSDYTLFQPNPDFYLKVKTFEELNILFKFLLKDLNSVFQNILLLEAIQNESTNIIESILGNSKYSKDYKFKYLYFLKIKSPERIEHISDIKEFIDQQYRISQKNKNSILYDQFEMLKFDNEDINNLFDFIKKNTFDQNIYIDFIKMIHIFFSKIKKNVMIKILFLLINYLIIIMIRV